MRPYLIHVSKDPSYLLQEHSRLFIRDLDLVICQDENKEVDEWNRLIPVVDGREVHDEELAVVEPSPYPGAMHYLLLHSLIHHLP